MPDHPVRYASRKFRVEARSFTARGRQHTYDIVAHPGAVVILPVLADGQIVLIHNYRVAVDAELLELPAGTLDPNEDPAACAARELAEETGYRAATLTPMTTFFASPGIIDERLHAFLATGLTPGPTALEPSEVIRPAITPLPDAIEAVRTGRIADAKTIICLLFYDRFLRPGAAS